MDVVIAGGGVAGLTVAALLSRTGQHDVTVLERASAYGQAGYGIGLYPLGGAVLNALGKGNDLRRRSTPLRTYEMRSPDGALLQSVDLDTVLADYGPMVGLSRQTLIDLLASCVPSERLRLGVQAAGVHTDGDRISVTDSDGRQYQADIVVAADGMHSAIRESLYGAAKPHDTGFDAWMWWAPAAAAPPHTVIEYWGPSAFCGLYPMLDAVNVAVAVPREHSPTTTASAEEIVAALRAKVSTTTPAVAESDAVWAATGVPFRWPLLDIRAPSITAYGDRLALVGDAGIGFLPTAGVGASNALRSAASLAFELSLSDPQSAPAAVRRWSQRVQRIVTKNQEDSRRLARVMLVKHRTPSVAINALMKHMPVTALTTSIVKSMEEPF